MDANTTALNLSELEQETYRDSIQDGLMFILLGIALMIMVDFLDNTFPLGILVILIIFVVPTVVERIRKRYVYPRIGYVKVKSSGEFDFLPFAIFMVTITAISVIQIMFLPHGFADSSNYYRVTPIFMGLVLFGPGMELSDRSGQDRYLLMGVLPTISGFLIVALSVQNTLWPPFRGLQIFSILWGSCAILLGAFMFLRFIRTHPILEEYDVQ